MYVKGYLELNDSILCVFLSSWQAGSNDSLVHYFFFGLKQHLCQFTVVRYYTVMTYLIRQFVM